jgi:sulfopyruvate decarboxylase TPP-binding subunit|tara:strand:- start:2170 stop:2325 length:156 start_codon:yes stop_codon:yes gene_type:complete
MDKIDKIVEEGNIISKLIEISDIKIYLIKRELELKDKLEKLKAKKNENSNA